MTFKIWESDSALFRPGVFLFAVLALSSPAQAQAIDWAGYC
jgi:hypothetical protein